MRIIALTNHKGGTGKTTTAVNFAAALRLRGFDVLLIDFDGQANATQIMNITGAPTIYDAMKQPAAEVTPVRVRPVAEGCGVLDVLPSCSDLSALDLDLARERDRVTRFRTVADKYRDKYDFILIDTPPTLGLLLVSSLYAADEIIITVQPEFLAVRGLAALMDVLNAVNNNRAEPLAVRALLTLYDKRRGIHKLIAEQVAASGLAVYDTRIRQNVAICEAQAANADIFTYSPNSNGARDYGAFCAEYLDGQKIKHHRHK